MEVEVKYPLINPKQVIKKLNSFAKSDKVNEFQKDTYYKFKSQLLRIRESKSGNFLSLKERIDDISCNNYCTKIRDVEPMKKILHILGLKKTAIVKKTRSTWLYKNCEIAIDNIRKFGYFIEIESHKKKDFLSIIKEIGAEIGKQNLSGYSKIHKKHSKAPKLN